AEVWRTDNGAQSWIDTNHAVPFGSAPGAGPCLVVDPANADHVLIGALNGHIHETFDAGLTWSDRDITGTSYPSIAFDSSSGTTTASGKTVTARIYVGWLEGATAIYHSMDGGQHFSAMASSPPSARGICCSSDGVLYVCDNGGSTTNAWKYRSSSWTHFTS